MLIFFILLIIALDQLTKILVFNQLKEKASIVLIDNFLELTYVENRGAAFGILQNQKLLFFIITILVLGFLFHYLYKNISTMSTLLKFTLALIIAGAIGNFIDRLFRGYVIDFIFVRFWGYYDFPVFNVADIGIVIGAILLIGIIIFTKELGD